MSFGRIKRGQRLDSAISARAWNRAQDAADLILSERDLVAATAGSTERAANVMLVRNATDRTVPRLGVLGIGGVVVSPGSGTLEGTDAASQLAREFARQPVLSGVVPDFEHVDRFVVLMEPAGPNDVVRAAVSGAFPCLVQLLDPSHYFATVKVGDVTQLQSSECGVLQLLWRQTDTGPRKWAVGVM